MIINLSQPAARYLVNGGLAAAAKDDVTPIICGVHLTAESPESLRFISTDRYRVHTAVIRAAIDELFEPFIVPRAALAWLGKNLAYFGRNYSREAVKIEKDPESSALSINVEESDGAGSVRWSGSATAGRFPPVLKLVDGVRDQPPAPRVENLNLQFLGGAFKLAPSMYSKAAVKFTVNEDSRKPGPVHISYEAEGVVLSAEALVQPMITGS